MIERNAQTYITQAIAAVNLARREDTVNFTEFTGYCIDAPQIIPAGSHYQVVRSGEIVFTSTVSRDGPR